MKSALRVFFEDTPAFDVDKTALKEWIDRVFDHHSATLNSLNIILCNDELLLALNRQYLNHDTLTDIITFPYNEPEHAVEGEIYISIDRVRENAGTLGVDWREELDRVIIHGVLHLLGFGDATPEQKEEMRRIEDYCLTLRA